MCMFLIENTQSTVIHCFNLLHSMWFLSISVQHSAMMNKHTFIEVKCDFLSPILKITQPFKNKMDSVTKLSTSNKCFMRNIRLAFQHQKKDAEIKRT